MRNRGHIANCGDGKADRLQRLQSLITKHQRAIQDAGTEAHDISLFEAHGSGIYDDIWLFSDLIQTCCLASPPVIRIARPGTFFSIIMNRVDLTHLPLRTGA